MKERLIEFLSYLGFGQNKFESIVGLSRGFVNNVGDSIRESSLAKISAVYPDLNINWLKTGEGDMLRSSNMQKIGRLDARGSKGLVGQMNGGTYNLHPDEGKDEVIKHKERQCSEILELLYAELHKFHDRLDRKDERIQEVIDNSFRRNEGHMKRLDDFANIIKVQSETLMRQDERTQDLAARLMTILEKKL